MARGKPKGITREQMIANVDKWYEHRMSLDNPWYWIEKGVVKPPSSRIARLRRGKYARIPEAWRGHHTHDSTKATRRVDARLKKRNRTGHGKDFSTY